MKKEDIKELKKMEELEDMRANLMELALFLLTNDPDRVLWSGYGRKCTIFNKLPIRFKRVYPFKITVLGRLYVDGIHSITDVVVSVLTKIQLINNTLKEMKH